MLQKSGEFVTLLKFQAINSQLLHIFSLCQHLKTAAHRLELFQYIRTFESLKYESDGFFFLVNFIHVIVASGIAFHFLVTMKRVCLLRNQTRMTTSCELASLI
jgi:hypothetical protein